MGIFSVLLALTVLLTGCELPDTPQKGGGAGLVILLPGAPGGASRAATEPEPGSIGHPAVQGLLTYTITLTKGSQKVEKSGSSGGTLNFPSLETGTWTITAKAVFQGHGNGFRADDPDSTNPAAKPQTVTLSSNETKSVSITLDLATALENKVLIPDAATFKKIGDPPGSGGWYGEEKEFLLLADLDLDDWEGPRISGLSATQRAVFDGGGHTVTIKGFAAVGAGYYGLFRDTYRAYISGLNIALDIPAGPTDTQFAGGLTPIASDTSIADIHVSGTLNVAATSWSGNSYAGGIVGEISGGDITSCSSKLNLKLETNSTFISTVGGIAGQITDAMILDSFFGLGGTVEGETVGGIVGEAQIISGSSNIKHCYSAGTVRGPSGTTDPITAGGIAGVLPTMNTGIDVSYFSGEIIIPTAGVGSAVGGIAGTITASTGIGYCVLLDPTVNVPSGVDVHRVVGGTNDEGALEDCRISTNLTYGGTFIQNEVSLSISDMDPGEGGRLTLSNNPPIVSDFPEELEVDYSLEFGFVMPKPGWDYVYPVLFWQIAKDIQP